MACLHPKGKDKMYTLTTDKRLSVSSALVEGNSIRSTECLTGVHRDTICRLLVTVGANCDELMEDFIWKVKVRYVEADEIWTYVGKKKRKVRERIT